MSYRMLDQCQPPTDPPVLEADLRALGAVAVGLYVVNLSVPSCERGAGYAQTLVQDGFGVLPIIVPGNSPPANLDLEAALRTWGALSCPVAIDLEGGSTPPLAWVQATVQQLNGAGWSCGIYGNFQYQSMYSNAAWDWHWLADWTYVPGIAQGYDAQQWSNNEFGPSGTRYDASDVVEGIKLWGRQTLVVTPVTKDPIPDEVSFPAVTVQPAPR